MSFLEKSTVAKKIFLILPVILLMLSVRPLPTRAAGGTGWYTPRARDHRQPVFGEDLRAVEPLGGYYMDYRHPDADAADKVVYLTFDAGYENGNVERILDALKAEGAVGAFFILGNLATRHSGLVRRMADEGHLVCNHTYTHKNLCGAPAGELTAELTRLETACRDSAGVEVAKYYRPPEGCFDEAMLREAREAGYKTVFWSFAYADWDNNKQPKAEEAKRKILDNTHNGAIILLHPNSETNAMILSDLIRTWREQGYRLASLSELDE